MAQDSLSLGKVISIVLEKEYSIRLAQKNAQLAAVNNTMAAAGMLPDISVNISQNSGINNIRQSLLSGQEIDRFGAGNKAFNAGIALNWTLFDGFAMFAQQDRLQALQQSSEQALRQQIERTLQAVIEQYYDIVRRKNLVQAALHQVELSEQRLQLAEFQVGIGKLSEQNALQARVEMNADRSALLSQQTLLRQAVASLNLLMAREPDIQYIFPDSIVPLPDIDGADILQKALAQNPALQELQARKAAAQASLSIARAGAFPRLNLTGNYSFTQSNNEASIVISNRNYGGLIALQAQYDVLNGFMLSQNIESARISIESVQLQSMALEKQINTSIFRALEVYKANKQILDLENQNTALAEKNIAIAFDKFKLGLISEFEFRIIQRSVYDARSRTVNAAFETIQAQAELLMLSGNLHLLPGLIGGS